MPQNRRNDDPTHRRLRLYARHQPRLPKPVSANKDKSGFSLKMIDRADRRFSVVRRMRERVKDLLEEAQSESLAKQFLAGRAVFILQYLESKEMDALEGIAIDWREYCNSVKALTATLKEIGASTESQRTSQRLEDYVIDLEQSKTKKPKKWPR